MARYRKVAAVADLRQAPGNGEASLPLAPTPAPPQPDNDEFDGLTKAELVERAEAAGLSTSGNKDALLERLRESSDE